MTIRDAARDDEQITLTIATGYRYPNTRSIKATPLWVSEELQASAGDTVCVALEFPSGVGADRLAFVLVRLDD